MKKICPLVLSQAVLKLGTGHNQLKFGIFWVTKVKFKGNTKITVMNECIFQNGEMLLYRKFNFGKSFVVYRGLDILDMFT